MTHCVPYRTAVLMMIAASLLCFETGCNDPFVLLVDQDLDGSFQNLDCDDLNSEILAPESYFYDLDGDGFGGEPNTTVIECEAVVSAVASGALVPVGGDCDDGAIEANPDGVERCDDQDWNCNGDAYDVPAGLEDTRDALGTVPWYIDRDGDGYGDDQGKPLVYACPQATTIQFDGVPYALEVGDCDTTNDEINPGADEYCATVGVDDNCNGEADENTAIDAGTFYQDLDGDGYGGENAENYNSCTPLDGDVLNHDDCDDQDATINPGAEEICAPSAVGVDDNCDGSEDDAPEADWYLDLDGDGYGDSDDVEALEGCHYPERVTLPGDCNDTLETVYPGAAEICDWVDNNCSGEVDEGQDGDGDGFTTCGNQACQDGYEDNPYCMWDCNDNNPDINSEGTEVCDPSNLDENCNGSSEDDDPTVVYSDADVYYRDSDNDGYGNVNATAIMTCEPALNIYASSNDDCDDTLSDINPGATEVCDENDTDEDCDGAADDQDSAAQGKVTYYKFDQCLNTNDARCSKASRCDPDSDFQELKCSNYDVFCDFSREDPSVLPLPDPTSPVACPYAAPLEHTAPSDPDSEESPIVLECPLPHIKTLALQHLVILNTEVTHRLWTQVMPAPLSTSDCLDCPVLELSVQQALEFCNQWSLAEGLSPAYLDVDGDGLLDTWLEEADGYRLPTASEWELAAQTDGAVLEGSEGGRFGADVGDCTDETRLLQSAWICGYGASDPSVVGLDPNPEGSHVPLGRTWEWVWESHPSTPDEGSLQPKLQTDRRLRGEDVPNASEEASGAASAASPPPDSKEGPTRPLLTTGVRHRSIATPSVGLVETTFLQSRWDTTMPRISQPSPGRVGFRVVRSTPDGR